MQGDGSVSSRRRENSARKLCFCRLDAEIRQAWTDKNPGQRFYGCPRYKDDGMHFRQPWAFGVEDEVRRLRMEVNDMAEEIAKLKRIITSTSRP
ncbi:hypothetical protein YC2023_076305 [Brassica napus]